MPVRFPAYRRHEDARIEANDAMMALLVASRLGHHTLGLMEGSTVFLPEVFPTVTFIGKLYRTVGDVRAMLLAAEHHLTAMAIPFVLAIHQVYADELLRLLSEDEIGQITLEEIHGRFEQLTGHQLPRTELEQFHLGRRIRNRILHYGSRTPSDFRSYFEQQMSKDGRALWIERAGRAPNFDPGEPLKLKAGELFAVLGTTKALADEMNAKLQGALGRDKWASIAYADWTARPVEKPKPNRFESLVGFTRHYYSQLALTEDELRDATALARSQKEDSSN